jgi:AraC family ethanolamine operon transcriptional activator
VPVDTSTHEAPIQVARLAFSSYEDFTEVAGESNNEWRQLDHGRFKARLLRVASASSTIERIAFNRRFAQRGSSPSGRLTLGLIGRDVGEIGWYRQRVSAQDLLVFSPGGEYESVSSPGFRGSKLSYSEEHLEQIAADFELPLDLGPYREGGFALKFNPAAAEDLRHRLRHLERAVTKCSGNAGRRWIRHELEHEIPVRLLRLLAAGPPQTSMLIDGFKARAARMARDYINAHAADAPAIQDVCRAVGVSWRALDYAFREVFGVTPKQYLQATRLQGARRGLHQGGPASTVTDIANNWGFWHIGKFAADYKRHFGELPSETLNSKR